MGTYGHDSSKGGTEGNDSTAGGFEVNNLLEIMMLSNPKTQALLAMQFLVCSGFSQADAFMLVIGLEGIINAKTFPSDINWMLLECNRLQLALPLEEDPLVLKIKQIDLELLAFMTIYKMNEHIDIESARKDAQNKDLGK